MLKDNQLRQLRGLEPISKSKARMDEYGNLIIENRPKENKTTYQVEDGAKIELVLDEQTKTCMVRCQDKTYPLFDEQNGLAKFVDSTGKPIFYDSRIPVKEGEEPIREEIDGKQIIKFGKNHEYTIPFKSQNNEYYTQMKYEKGETINIVFPGQTSALKAFKESKFVQVQLDDLFPQRDNNVEDKFDEYGRLKNSNLQKIQDLQKPISQEKQQAPSEIGSSEKDMGKTGDSRTGQVTEKHRAIATSQIEDAKQIMLQRRLSKGK